MDLALLDVKKFAEEGALLHFKHPATGELLKTEDGEPIGFMMKGGDSSTLRKIGNKTVKQMRAKAKLKSTKDDDNDDDALGTIESDTAEILAQLVFGFVNLVEDKIDLQYSYEKTVELLIKYPWQLEQAKLHRDNRDLFTKG